MTNLAKTLLAVSIGATALSGINHAQTQSQPVKNIVLVHGAFADGTSCSRMVFVVTPGGLEEYFLGVAKCSPAPDPPNWLHWLDRSV